MNRVNFAILVAASVLLFGAAMHGNAFAETSAKSTNFEKTTIIEFVNTGAAQVKTVKMWLGQSSGTFTSFKTESGWTGAKSPEGLLVFTTDSPVSQGESVKFGLKTEVANPGINWKTIDTNGNDISIGKVTATQDATPPSDAPSDTTPPQSQPTQSDFDSATFRIIPETPKNGDNIRIVGDGFPKNQQIDFYIDNEKIDDFMSDNSGHVVGKAKVPVNEADRVEFSLADTAGHKKTISIRIGHADVQAVDTREKHIVVKEFPEIVSPGQTVHASGTGKPGSTLTVTAKDPTGKKIYEVAIPVDNQGNWSHEVVIPPDAGIGSRVVEVSDGVETITKTVSIVILNTIRLTPSMTQYKLGDMMEFNGTAVGGKPLDIVIKDPIGKEIFSDIIQVNDTGAVDFKFATDATMVKGTYVMLASQGLDTDVVRVGVGEPPGDSIVAKFDKLNYATSDKAKMTIRGPANVNVSILILDPSDKPKGPSEYVKLGADGQRDYEIDLSSYKSGVYSAVLKYQKFQTSEIFTVGLQFGAAGEIKMQATKQTYLQGSSILVLGSAKPNSLLNLKFTDPSGAAIRHKEIFTDKNGKFSDSTFRVPADAIQGVWVVRAESGANYADVPINVSGTSEKTFTIITDKAAYKPKDIIKISGSGGGKSQTVIATITDSAGKKVVDLNTITTSDGVFKVDWITPADMQIGEYKIKVKTGIYEGEIAFMIQ